MTGNGYSRDQVLEAVKDSKGFITMIAKRLGCSRKHVYSLLKKYPAAADAVEDERETTKDWVEGKLLQRIEKNDTTALIFYAKTQMKDRGYVERQEMTGANGGAIEVSAPQIFLPDIATDE